MGGYTIASPQTVEPNQPLVFNTGFSGCRIYQKNNGVFLLANTNNGGGCCCRRTTDYEVEVHANIEVPTGGAVEEISLALAVDGITAPASAMRYTPAAVETAGNVGTSIIVSVPGMCHCESVAVVNTSTQPITVTNASLVIDYAGRR